MFDRYVSSNIPTEADTPGKLSLLKADLTRVLDVLHWHYSLIPIRERLRKSLTSFCLVMVIFYTVFLGGILAWCNFHNANFLAMLACVLYCGVIGGFVSSQRRMQGIPSDGDPLISVFGLANADYYLWLSPLLGAIFAVILTLMFIAGILRGSFFPDFYISSSGAQPGLPFISLGTRCQKPAKTTQNFSLGLLLLASRSDWCLTVWTGSLQNLKLMTSDWFLPHREMVRSDGTFQEHQSQSPQ